MAIKYQGKLLLEGERQSQHPYGCEIVSVGKRRDGGTRYWCLAHKADATAKYGVEAEFCRYAHIPPLMPDDRVVIDLDEYPGGVGAWGAVPAVYDTTIKPIDRGIHVHARRAAAAEKVVDQTFRHVTFKQGDTMADASELDAIYFMVSHVFGFDVKPILCTYCGYSHLDKDWFSVHPHESHLCSGCGRNFRDNERAVGNPIGSLAASGLGHPAPTQEARKKLKIAQADYPGGIQIWGSNPPLLWTSSGKTDTGIHVHAFASDSDELPVVDDTFASVEVDGIELNQHHIRTYMAQQAMPHLAKRVVSVDCQVCGTPAFDAGYAAYTAKTQHNCVNCGSALKSLGRLRKVIFNPMPALRDQLSETAVRMQKEDDLGLIPEAPF